MGYAGHVDKATFAAPTEPVRVPALRQRWDSITFIHWRFPPDRVKRLLPDELEVEEWDGSAWVGLTPFVAKRTRMNGLPPLPFGSDFPETNCRTYVRTRQGESAIWFFSLEADNPAVVLAANSLLGVPYRSASMTATTDGARHLYRSRRRGRSNVGHSIEVEVGQALPADNVPELAHWLTARWRAVVPRGDAVSSCRSGTRLGPFMTRRL